MWDTAALVGVLLYLPAARLAIQGFSRLLALFPDAAASWGAFAADHHYAIFVSRALFVEWSLFALIWLILRRRGRPLAEIGLTGRGFLPEALLGVGYMVAFWLFACAVLELASRLGGLPLIGDVLPRGGAGRVFSFHAPRLDSRFAVTIAFALTAGVCEETIFRGYLLTESMRLIRRRVPAVVCGLALSSLFFGLLHVREWHDLDLFAISAFGGFCCAVAVLWRKNLTSAIVAHVLFNLQGLYLG